MDKTITLTKEERDIIYFQLSARKDYFEEDMMNWAKKGDTSEVKRCFNAMQKIEDVMNKIINS